MAEPLRPNDLVGTVSDALKGYSGGLSAAGPRRAPGNEQQMAASMRRQRDDIERLQRSQEELTRKVEALEKRTNSLLGVLDNVKDFPRQQQELQSQLTSVRIQQIGGVVANAQAAAFGETGSVLAPNNLWLAGNQLFWLLLDPVLRRFGIITGTSPSIVTWLAPVGSLLTGQLALGSQQHTRFISGVVTVVPGEVALDTLRNRIADGYWDEFQRRSDILVTATVLDQPLLSAAARVREGVLEIRVVPSGGVIPISAVLQPPVRVAWILDTGVGSG